VRAYNVKVNARKSVVLDLSGSRGKITILVLG
jgi:hypothetical protein